MAIVSCKDGVMSDGFLGEGVVLIGYECNSFFIIVDQEMMQGSTASIGNAFDNCKVGFFNFCIAELLLESRSSFACFCKNHNS